MIGADTSFLIDFLKGDVGAISFMEKNADKIHVCEASVFEFLVGNLSSRQHEEFLAFAQQFPSCTFERNEAIAAAKLYREQKRKGKSVGMFDAIIAGSFAANNVEKIVTRNTKHFAALPIKVLQY